jgi:hypothetical protein
MAVSGAPVKENAMPQTIALTFLALAALGAAGCETSQGTTRALGTNNYEAAFATSEEVMSNHFRLKVTDPTTGVIESLPKPSDEQSDMLLTSVPTRRVATLRLRREADGVYATLSVAIQQQGQEGFAEMNFNRQDYLGRPRQTPAEQMGATTAEQNDLWTYRNQDKGMEVRLLGQIRDRLNPASGFSTDTLE